MAYCRYNDDPNPDEEYCDIYLYGDIGYNSIICFECCMNNFNDVMFKKRSDVISHIEQHLVMGHDAPYDYVFSKLREEIDEEGDHVDFGEAHDSKSRTPQ